MLLPTLRYDDIPKPKGCSMPGPSKVNDELNAQLRPALYSIYVAIHSAMKLYPAGFDKNHATRMLTHLMGSRPWSWPVVGITRPALQAFADNGFKNHKGQVQRGHLIHRSDTALVLFFDQATMSPLALPLEEADFFDKFLQRDKTVLMIRKENPARSRSKLKITDNALDIIEFGDPTGLFSCGSLVGWKHGAQEVNFLKHLCSTHDIVGTAPP